MPHKCPIARAEYQRLRYQKNKERMKETRRIYRQENKEKASEYRKLWREKNSEYNREYYEKNKEKVLEQKREWREKNKERYEESYRLYHEKNKEKVNERHRIYREENKEKISEHHKEYTKTPEGIKTYRLSKWKCRGLIHDDIHELYERYLQATHCEECQIEFINDKGPKQRCMDHCHETGLFRNFLCNSCNFKRR